MEQKKKKMSDEEVTALLKTSAKKRRTRKSTILLFWLALFLIPIGLAIWWFWPTPPPPHLLIVAFDHLCLPGEEVQLQARLTPQKDEDPAARLGGWPIEFQEQQEIRVPGQPLWQYNTKSTAAGTASAMKNVRNSSLSRRSSQCLSSLRRRSFTSPLSAGSRRRGP